MKYIVFVLLVVVLVAVTYWMRRLILRGESDETVPQPDRQEGDMDKEPDETGRHFHTHVSHELRIRLASIVSQLEELMKERSDDAPLVARLEVIHRHASSLMDEDDRLPDADAGPLHDDALEVVPQPAVPEPVVAPRVKNRAEHPVVAPWHSLDDPLPSGTKVMSPDEKLVDHAVRYVEDNMAKSDLSVEELSQALGMSRVHLYKKLVAITGKTPIEFIRGIRLKRAAQLLSRSRMNVSEVAYQVGFNNPKYFSRYFKEEFGVLPSNFMAGNGK